MISAVKLLSAAAQANVINLHLRETMDHTNTSILIVDDDETNRDILSRRLLREGYTVEQAADGRQALNLLEVERYDLILLDIMMPGMDGYEVLLKIKNDPRLHDIPVIMFSAVADRFSMDRCQTLGAYDYLIKPCEVTMLKARMWRCLFELKLNRPTNRAEHPPRVILIVEDNALNRDLLSRRVKKLGHIPLIAASGDEGLTLLEQNTVDLILLDIMMPRMDGCELLQTLRSRQPLRNVPIIMVSALGDNASLERCRNLGADDFVVKPYNAVILRDRISRALTWRDDRLKASTVSNPQAQLHPTSD